MISAPSPRVPSIFTCGASAGITIDRRNAEPPRGDRHAAGVIARGKGDHAALAAPRRQLQQPVGRAPQLERAAGLQALAFEPDSAPAISLSISGVRSTSPAIRSAGFNHIVSSDLGTAFAKLVDISPFRLTVADQRHNDRRFTESGPKNLYRGDPHTYIAPRCPMGLPTARQLCVEHSLLEVP